MNLLFYMTEKSFQFQFHKDNTFCISLLSHIDRWQKMMKRFTLLNMNVTRFNASIEKDLSIDPLPFSNSLNTLQKCCAHSHIQLWKLLLSSKEDYFLILEDDACFDKEWLKKIDLFTLHETKDWDAIFLNASEPFEIPNVWYLCQDQYLCGGYILSKQGANKLLEMFQQCYFSADWMTTRLQTKNACYSFYPWLIIQEGNDTTIGSGVELDHKKVVRCLEEINYSLLDHYIL